MEAYDYRKLELVKAVHLHGFTSISVLANVPPRYHKRGTSPWLRIPDLYYGIGSLKTKGREGGKGQRVGDRETGKEEEARERKGGMEGGSNRRGGERERDRIG